MTCRTLVVGLMLTAISALTIPNDLAADEFVPFKGTLSGSYTAIPVDPQQPLVIQVQLDAAGNSTQTGTFNFDFPHIVDRSKRPSIGVGFCDITAANGDHIYAYIEGEAKLVVPGLLYGVENATIIGGTGRFFDASGTFTITRLINQQELTTTGSFRGSISAPRAGR